ncbi:unnamed protein product [Vitrella brassicaformis CCMP3155]|uniref:SET domain-containing protein n=1 Tax=Vitrella brassicaformis (strain CCMP3155) TaxID=1169540 RepID=A0A0G4G5T2_VITBC|nr:unnamed protein product [Vitrella brassicaformis CCMP3155]|eukprot:CEM23446.1 unnamed protein product [Vitrella brassicaformis CCMP3155]
MHRTPVGNHAWPEGVHFADGTWLLKGSQPDKEFKSNNCPFLVEVQFGHLKCRGIPLPLDNTPAVRQELVENLNIMATQRKELADDLEGMTLSGLRKGIVEALVREEDCIVTQEITDLEHPAYSEDVPTYMAVCCRKKISRFEVTGMYGNLLVSTDRDLDDDRYTYTVSAGRKGRGGDDAGEEDAQFVFDGKPLRNHSGMMNDARWTGKEVNVVAHQVSLWGIPYMCHIAIRDILPGEELLVDYGDKYWATLALRFASGERKAKQEVRQLKVQHDMVVSSLTEEIAALQLQLATVVSAKSGRNREQSPTPSPSPFPAAHPFPAHGYAEPPDPASDGPADVAVEESPAGSAPDMEVDNARDIDLDVDHDDDPMAEPANSHGGGHMAAADEMLVGERSASPDPETPAPPPPLHPPSHTHDIPSRPSRGGPKHRFEPYSVREGGKGTGQPAVAAAAAAAAAEWSDSQQGGSSGAAAGAGVGPPQDEPRGGAADAGAGSGVGVGVGVPAPLEVIDLTKGGQNGVLGLDGEGEGILKVVRESIVIDDD